MCTVQLALPCSFGVMSRFSLYCRSVYCTACSTRFKVDPELEMNRRVSSVLGVWRMCPPPMWYSMKCWGYEMKDVPPPPTMWYSMRWGDERSAPPVWCWRICRGWNDTLYPTVTRRETRPRGIRDVTRPQLPSSCSAPRGLKGKSLGTKLWTSGIFGFYFFHVSILLFHFKTFLFTFILFFSEL